MELAHPFTGAEVFIEPGQTALEIDTWFRVLRDCGMRVTRIRLFESYMRVANGEWDYSLFDRAFTAAEKYGIGIYGNLFPLTDFNDVGGFKFPNSEQHLADIAEYIRNVVPHFSSFSSLVGWVPLNEPGSGNLPDRPFTRQRFDTWKTAVVPADYSSQGYTRFDFSEQQFLLEHNTWFLGWLAAEIRRYDPHHDVHVNNHALFQHVAEYRFPDWRPFLDSFGGSAHAGWHFGYFRRAQFAMALSAKSELIRSGAGRVPWFMTELQGGNNTYSAFHPMCPTREEIIQWIWVVIATGGRGALFWCLNARGSGFEAGEWAMLDFHNEPTDRLLAAKAVNAVLNDQAALFAHAEVIESGITVIYTRESLWIEKALQVPGTQYEGRAEGGVMKSALAWFEAVTEMGVQCSLKEIGEVDFNAENFTGKTLILSHQVSLPSAYWTKLKAFVSKGGKLIADGLTGYYDEHAHCILKSGFPLEEVFGAAISEFKLLENTFDVRVGDQNFTAHLWQGYLRVTTAESLDEVNGRAIACRNRFGRGEVVWVPSLIGLGSRISGNYGPLCRFLEREVDLSAYPLRFESPQALLLMKSLRSGAGVISILVNNSAYPVAPNFRGTHAAATSAVLFSSDAGAKDELLRPGGTRVMIHTD